jgi:hypothetical protein
MRRLFSACLAASILSLLSVQAEARQSDDCERYRGELADLRHQGGSNSVAAEIAQLTRYKQDIGCLTNNGFFDTNSAACSAVDSRIQSILQTGVTDRNDDVRDKRQRLRTLIRQTCEAPARPRETVVSDHTDADKNVPKASGGSKLICVRMCDGAFSPMEKTATGDADPDELCKASCPGTDAAAYTMPPTDDGLDDAASVKNRSAYTALANAYLFRKSRPATCTCAVDGVSWSESLQKAEALLPKHKNDVIVTAAISQNLSVPNANVAKILASYRASKTNQDVATADTDSTPSHKRHIRREHFHSSLRYASAPVRRRQYAHVSRPVYQSPGFSQSTVSTYNPSTGIFNLFQ